MKYTSLRNQEEEIESQLSASYYMCMSLQKLFTLFDTISLSVKLSYICWED